MSDYMPKCATCEHFESCIIQKHLIEMALILWNISKAEDKADRKTENSSEKPNNCEHITEDGVTCAKYPACDDCLDNPLNKVKGSERLVKGSEQTDLVEDSPSLVKDLVKAFGEDGTWLERQGVYTLTLAEAKQRAVDIIESVLAKDEPTISKMEQVEEPQMGDAKPIPLSNRVTHIKDEPKTQMKTQNSNLTFEKRTMLDCYNCKRFETEEECIECRYEPKGEPQTEEWYTYQDEQEYNDRWQTDCAWK